MMMSLSSGLRELAWACASLILLSGGYALAEDAATPAKPQPTEWRSLFDGKTLKNWAITGFGGEGEVEVTDGTIVMQQGAELTGIHWEGTPLPKINYELELEAQRIDGSDFFCGIVFPAKDEYCSFVVGGWGGGVVGLSSVDGLYATENETATFQNFDAKKWYKIRLRVGEDFIQAWIDNKPAVDLNLKDRKLSVHPAVALSKPLGISCFSTVSGIRNIQFRELKADERKHQPLKS
ncbi:DUF1080 domain-containing protein [bacterium]|nr:DUF1080 domain-containing protein [bacterium]